MPETALAGARAPVADRRQPSASGFREAALLVMVIAVMARAAVVFWHAPLTPHHPDEGLLSREAIALWEGVTPREVGWPASTTRLMLGVVHGLQLSADVGSTLWRQRTQPQAALETIVQWIAHRSADSAPLFRAARTLCIAIGVLQVAVCLWGGRRWFDSTGAIVSAAVCALAPIAVTHSQYVLADVTGLLFATAALGLLPNATAARLNGAAVLVALAAASKFHFGLWLLPVLALAWRVSLGSPVRRLGAVALPLVLFTSALVALVPWFWLDPLLAAKEFAGVVAVKVGSGAPARALLWHLPVLFGGLGILAWGLLLVRPLALWRSHGLEGTLVTATVIAGTVVLAASQIVFDRYALVLLPGVTLMAGAAGTTLLSGLSARSVPLMRAVVAVLCIAALVQLAAAERRAGEPNVDWDVREWLLAHVPAGSRIAVHAEFTQFLPRTAQQLDACASLAATRAAYVQKWASNGVTIGPSGPEPFRRAILNDELFAAYWCGREQLLSTPGFEIVPYHDGARFGAWRTGAVLREFGEGLRDASRGFDVLVTSFPLPHGPSPAAVFTRLAGRRLIYVRRAAASR
jgi:4-amino-4-deoxy-L-arabinose transferase-like glycosyltransferase